MQMRNPGVEVKCLASTVLMPRTHKTMLNKIELSTHPYGHTRAHKHKALGHQEPNLEETDDLFFRVCTLLSKRTVASLCIQHSLLKRTAANLRRRNDSLVEDRSCPRWKTSAGICSGGLTSGDASKSRHSKCWKVC